MMVCIGISFLDSDAQLLKENSLNEELHKALANAFLK